MKQKLLIAIVAVAALMFAPPKAAAQTPGVYTLLSGGNTHLNPATTNIYVVNNVTNNIGTPGTSSNLVLSVSEYDNVGLTFQYVGVAQTTNGSCGLSCWQSHDNGTTYESAASYTFLATPTGAATLTVATNLVVKGATHLAFTIQNASTNAAAFMTNVLLKVNLKSFRVQSQPAGINAGTSPGTPITVPNFP